MGDVPKIRVEGKHGKVINKFKMIVHNFYLTSPYTRPTKKTGAMSFHEPEQIPTILYLDAEQGNRAAFQDAFREDVVLLLAESLEEAMALLATQEVHVVISNQHMPGMKGGEALRQIKDRFPKARRMLITAHADLQALVDALNNAEVCHYIEKPWEVAAVRRAILKAWEQYKAEQEREVFTEQLLESNRQLEFALRQSLLS